MRFKKSPRLPGAGRARVWHHHGSDMPTSPRTIYVLKSANGGLFYTPLYAILECGFSLPEILEIIKNKNTLWTFLCVKTKVLMSNWNTDSNSSDPWFEVHDVGMLHLNFDKCAHYQKEIHSCQLTHSGKNAAKIFSFFLNANFKDIFIN